MKSFESVRRLFLFLSLFLAIASPVHAADRTVLVAVDKAVYLSGETDLLKAEIRQAIQSEFKPVDVGYLPNKITLTIHDLDHDREFADRVEKYFANRAEFSVARDPALTIRISYSEQALKTYHRDRLEQDYNKLDAAITGMRTLPTGVTIEPDTDGAILRATDSAFADRLAREAASLLVTPITKTSWHIDLNKDMQAMLGPASRIAMQREMGGFIRYMYGDPVGMATERTEDGIAVLVPNPSADQAFISQVRAAFAHDADFVVTETPALVFRVSQTDGKSNESLPEVGERTPSLPAPELTTEPLAQAAEALNEIANPTAELVVMGSVVSARAKNPADADRVAVFVRHVLAGRSDLVIAPQPDKSLLIRLAPGAHIVPPRPPLRPGQLVSAIKTRLDRLNLQATQISSIDNDHASVELRTPDDAVAFRAALSKPSGLSIRLVDEASDSTNTPPSPGDERVQLPTKEYIWVSPRTIVTGDMIADADTDTSKYTDAALITFRFTEEGRLRFGAASQENVGRRFVIIIDGKAVEAPVIKDAILGGKGQIEGGFSGDEAAELAQAIRAHRTDLPLRVVDGASR